VTAVAHLGKTHPIEVEDEVSAILEYENGATGHFITTTGEAPGTDRLEIAGDRGKLVSEGGNLSFRMSRKSVREFRETDPGSFTTPECWDIEVPAAKAGPEAKFLTQNFINAILKDEPLICPGQDGVKGLEIGNAMLMAGVTRKPVDMPLDGDAYEAFLKDLTQKYGGKKKLSAQASSSAENAMGASFGRRN
jgi:predicted dehydrogenase